MADRENDEFRNGPAPAEGEPRREAEPEGPAEAPEEASAEEEAETLRNRLAYLAAEFDNYRKRMGREREALVAFANEKILRAILPTLDNLERAMGQGASAGSSDSLLAGVRLTYETFLQELSKFGVEPIVAAGVPFDPALHEAIAMVPAADVPEGTVVAEARRGYLLHGRLLRPAQVTVAKGGAGSASGTPGR